MRKIINLSVLIVLSGCTVGQGDQPATDQEEATAENTPLTGSFKLEAAQGYVPHSDSETPHTYVIDTDKNEVYVDINPEGFTEEELERITNMTEEEADEFFSSQPEYEEPIYDIMHLEAAIDSILLEYEGEAVQFTALSDSYYETEDGTRYILEEDVSIEEYVDSFYEAYIIE